MLITVNVPHIRGEYDEEEVDLELGKQGQLIGDAVEYASTIWSTFKVKDWNLFQRSLVARRMGLFVWRTAVLFSQGAAIIDWHVRFGTCMRGVWARLA